ncbi:MAG: hypothetical protein ACJZ0Y_03240 [Cytophagales bacterium]|nr:MAG: hypothetical protein CND83_04530 [Rhodothermaeota bacterium MED-G19]
MKIKAFLILILFFISTEVSFSQNSEYFDTEKEVFWGINKNSWGGLIGGGVLKFSNKVSDNMYQTIGLEAVNIKHPKENKYSSALGYGRTFVWGKKNYLFSIRGQYGREMILVNKKDPQGIRINAQVAVGPSLGLLIPYYIKYSRNNKMEIENFDSTIHTFNNVIGSASFLEGLDELKIKPGINFKAALNFEFGGARSATAIEVGFLADIFSKEVVMMPTAKNYSVYPTAFITLFYGRKY